MILTLGISLFFSMAFGQPCLEVPEVYCHDKAIHCWNGTDENGCDLGGYCFEPTDPCQNTCPCNPETEISCPSPPPIHGWNKNCLSQICLPKESFLYISGYVCPSVCRPDCPEDFVECPFTFDEKGCAQKQV